jgi:hypothetical protein
MDRLNHFEVLLLSIMDFCEDKKYRTNKKTEVHIFSILLLSLLQSRRAKIFCIRETNILCN